MRIDIDRIDTSDPDFKKLIEGWSLTTAEITYRMPDFRNIVQIFIWQEYDLPPKFPRLMKFLDFWSHNLEGPLAEVRVAHAHIVQPATLRHVNHEWQLQ
jgi:uncharacterized protein Usg